MSGANWEGGFRQYDKPDGERVGDSYGRDQEGSSVQCFRCHEFVYNNDTKHGWRRCIVLCNRAFCDECFPLMVAVLEADVKVRTMNGLLWTALELSREAIRQGDRL